MDFTKLANAGGHASTLDFTKAQEVTAGERIDFTKANPDVKVIRAELYWESDNDGDVSAVVLDANKKALPGAICFYGNPAIPGLSHSGDVTGDTDGDPSTPEETIRLVLAELADGADSVLFIASTYPSTNPYFDEDGNQIIDDSPLVPVPFGKLRDCRVLIINDETSEVLYGYELDEDFSTFTSVELCSFYKKDGGWRMTNMGEGVGKSAKALEDVAAKYGL